MQKLKKKLERVDLKALLIEFKKNQYKNDNVEDTYKKVIGNKVTHIIEKSLHSSDLFELFDDMNNVKHNLLKEIFGNIILRIQELLVAEVDDFKKSCTSVVEAMEKYVKGNKFFNSPSENPYLDFYRGLAKKKAETIVDKNNDIYFLTKMIYNAPDVQNNASNVISIYRKKVEELEFIEFWFKIMSCTSLEEAKKLQYNNHVGGKRHSLAIENICMFCEDEYKELYKKVKEDLNIVPSNSDIGKKYKKLYEVFLEEEIMVKLDKVKDTDQVLRINE